MKKYFDLSKTNGFTVVTIAFSELSIEEVQEFKQHFYDLISETQNKFIIDMRRCTFLPSAVLGIMIGFNLKVKEKGGKIVFCNLTEEVRTIFNITHLNRVLEIFETQGDAVKAFT